MNVRLNLVGIHAFKSAFESSADSRESQIQS